jgi:predicted O-methyltransferase YrrM
MKRNSYFIKFYPFLHDVRMLYRQIAFRVRRQKNYRQIFYYAELAQALASSQRISDISEHLSALFYHAAEVKPKFIVELGTGTGESTRALLAVAALNQGRVLSLDIKDCSWLHFENSARWDFIKSDDIEFGETRFLDWCASQNLPPHADVIFVDTSHLYEHTREELRVWVPYLSDTGVMIFHDTNMGQGVYGRLDGTVGVGWDNHRGVIRAVEEFLGRHYDETKFFIDFSNGFLVRHYPNSNGLTVLKRFEYSGQIRRSYPVEL